MVLKRVLLSLSIISALIISQAAWTDNRNNRRGYGAYSSGQYNYGKATEITTVQIVARIPITMARVVRITIENTAEVMAVVWISPTEITIRSIDAMIQVVF